MGHVTGESIHFQIRAVRARDVVHLLHVVTGN
jgi:hypothetical protein